MTLPLAPRLRPGLGAALVLACITPSAFGQVDSERPAPAAPAPMTPPGHTETEPSSTPADEGGWGEPTPEPVPAPEPEARSRGTELQPAELQPAPASQSALPRLELDPQQLLEDPWQQPRPRQLGITVGVPVFDESILNGDLTVDIRYGRKFGWVVPYVSGGFRQTRLDPKRVPDHARRKKLEAWHVTAGLRVEFPVSQQFLPFVGVAGELARWGFQADSTEFCQEPFYPEAWRCYTRYDWKHGRALKSQLGFIYKPEPSLALEFWLEHGWVHAPEMFTRPVTFITPTVGLAWHH